MVLPAGTTVPPLVHLVVLLVAAGATVAALLRVDPVIEERTVMALAPWMVAGATLYVAVERGLVPAVVRPFLTSPAVYVTAFVGAGTVWSLGLWSGRDPALPLAVSGLLVALVPTGAALLDADTIAPEWPLGAAALAAVVTAGLWWLLRAWEPRVEVLGWAGAMTVFAHALDALTTVLGVVHMDFVERTPLSRLLIDVAVDVPVPVLGAGWLFVLVKLLLGAGVAWLLAPTVHDEPRIGFLILVLVIAVGLGPGVNNVLLFTVAG
jgi:uncharacterized membrane protein